MFNTMGVTHEPARRAGLSVLAETCQTVTGMGITLGMTMGITRREWEGVGVYVYAVFDDVALRS